MNKPGRNDLCPCGSGKKFKKCCELKQKNKKINAQVITPGQAKSLSSFFQRNVTVHTNAEPKNIKVDRKEDAEPKDQKEEPEPKNIIM